jgi:alkylation response protein AidB-like acyl-CoA dehydrogenase
MSFAMTPHTEPGARLVAAAQALIPRLRERAESSDRAGVMNRDNFDDVIQSGIAAAFVPVELGGFGLESMHDWAAGIATLARGDASTSIAINMHLGVSRGMVAAWRIAKARGSVPETMSAPLKAIAEGRMLICATATERGTDNLHPLTEATPAADGLRIDGTKMFVTMSPIATHLGMNLRLRDEQGDHLATTLLPINTPGIEPQDDWDSLGMRASGSQSIRFENVRVPHTAVRKLGPWGRWSTTVLTNRTLGNLTLVAAFLGMGEYASEIALATLAKQQRNGQGANSLSGVQHMVGEMEIELATCRSIMQQAALRADAFLSLAHPTLAEAHELMKDYQCTKWVVNQGAIRLVNQAMDVVGGSSFVHSHPLARLYRDVRAGPFMQPGSRPEARAYIGQVTLGQFPDA